MAMNSTKGFKQEKGAIGSGTNDRPMSKGSAVAATKEAPCSSGMKQEQGSKGMGSNDRPMITKRYNTSEEMTDKSVGDIKVGKGSQPSKKI